MKKITVLSLLFFISAVAVAQINTPAEADALMNRCKNFDETKKDSLLIYSGQLEAFGKKEKYNNAISDALRVRGWYYEATGNYDSAITMHLKNIDYAFEHVDKKKAVGLYSDMVSVYKATKLYDKAKEYAIKLMEGSRELKDTVRMSSGYVNMGLCYRNLKQSDSAFFCYNEALKLKTLMKDSAGMANLRINLSSYYYHENDFVKAYETILPNIEYHLSKGAKNDLWYDYSAAATALNGLKRFDESKNYLDLATTLLDSTAKTKLAETYRVYSELYRMQGNYQLAFEYLDRASDMEIEFINEDNSRIIAETKEKFETEKKEQQNELLTAQVGQQKLQKRNITIIAVAIALLASLIGVLLWQKQRANKKLQSKNDIINRQINKLNELNQEKNSLIGIVSHDLANPFGNINVWTQVLQRNSDGLSEKQQEAIRHIKDSTGYGQQLIRSILDVEKASAGDLQMNLELVELQDLIVSVVAGKQKIALAKNQQILFEGAAINLMTDRQMISRICDNLISNAIKYSQPEKNIYVSLREENNNAIIEVKDEGVGIPEHELPLLFSKYSRISSRPTAGEESTGLGLSIVKRLVEELNGKIYVESVEGKGTEFTVSLKK